MIEAEVQLADGDLEGAKTTMEELLDLVEDREVAALVDVTEDRTESDPGSRPMEPGWGIAFSPQDTFHTGLVISRRSQVMIPVVSGTAVTDDLIDRTKSMDEAVELLYRLRQEIFIAEGRRMYDLGIQWPVPEVEVLNNPNIDDGSTATDGMIPAFLPPGSEFDTFESIDFDSQEAVLLHNLNNVISANRSSGAVAPLF